MALLQLIVESLKELKRVPLRIRDINMLVEDLRRGAARQHAQLDAVRKEIASARSEVDSLRRAVFFFGGGGRLAKSSARVVTEHPIATGSADHQVPRGAVNDNTRHPRFVQRVEDVLGRNLSVLDLGCAGGGLVLDFLIAGHDAIGIEGSDAPKRRALGEWLNMPDRLFTADITKPFKIVDDTDSPKRFDLVTAWEVMEHIGIEQIKGLFENVRKHLRLGGLFVVSIATFEDADPESGAVFHVTVKPRQWWEELFVAEGFHLLDGMFDTADFPRGSGNPTAHDWNARANPELGFHLVSRFS